MDLRRLLLVGRRGALIRDILLLRLLPLLLGRHLHELPVRHHHVLRLPRRLRGEVLHILLLGLRLVGHVLRRRALIDEMLVLLLPLRMLVTLGEILDLLHVPGLLRLGYVCGPALLRVTSTKYGAGLTPGRGQPNLP